MLKDNKAHGTDGMQEEAYKTIRTWIAEPVTDMINEIKTGNNCQKNGEMGEIIHIYKNKGDAKRMRQLQANKLTTNNVQNMT